MLSMLSGLVEIPPGMSVAPHGLGRLYTSKLGRMRYERLSARVMYLTNEGIQGEEFAQIGVALARVHLKESEELVLLSDSEHLLTASTEFKDVWTAEIFRPYQDRFLMLFLHGTRMMAMAMRVVNMLLARRGRDVLLAYTDAPSWERACRVRYPPFERLPLPPRRAA